MPRRGSLGLKAAVWSAVAVVLFVVAVLSGRQVAAVDETKCQSVAPTLIKDPNAAAFRQCAVTSPIPPSCCVKLVSLVPYVDCLQVAKYKAMADQFLAPNVTVDRTLRECLRRRRR